MNITPRCRNYSVPIVERDRLHVVLKAHLTAAWSETAEQQATSESSPSKTNKAEPFPQPRFRLLPTVVAATIIFLLPSTLYIPEDNAYLRFVFSFWMSWLRVSPILVATVVGAVTVWLAPDLLRGRFNLSKDILSRCPRPFRFVLHPACVPIILSLAFALAVGCTGPLQVIFPSWAWYPFIWGRYRVYHPHELSAALQPLCIANSSTPIALAAEQDKLCLNKKSWEILSAGYLSRRRPNDVANVLMGIQYAKSKSGGLVVGILARDTRHAIEPLRQNVEALAKFFPDKLTIVVFENDSVDGTRAAFQQWATETDGYRVDLMSCGAENPNCNLKEPHRHDANDKIEFMQNQSAGKLPRFRQQLLEYVLEDSSLQEYSHMMVMDLDLAVSISPLGVMHSLGIMPDKPIASSGRMPLHGSLGTVVLPYDTVAMRYAPTFANQRLLNLHRQWCELAPPGDRWRFECANTSPFSLMLTVDATSVETEPYKMRSAFNGAILYPLNLIRRNKPFYHAGKDGQSCEHVAFHESLNSLVYVNPKWSYHIDPNNPGGPTGSKGLNTTLRVVLFHRLSSLFTLLVCTGIFLFVYSTKALVLNFVYPLSTSMLRRLDFARRQELPLVVKKDFLFTRDERIKALN